MNNPLTQLELLSQRCWEAIAEQPCSVTGQRVDVPAFVPVEELTVDARYGDDFPVLRYLERALERAVAAGFGDIVEMFRALLGEVRWSQNASYTTANCDQSLLDGYAYAGLSGPDGPIHAMVPRGGFYLMGPDVVYPDHSHGPREVYFVFTGGVEWRLDRGDWFDVAPGSLIYHDAWVAHAMRSAAEPVLAYAGWIEPGDRGSVTFSAQS